MPSALSPAQGRGHELLLPVAPQGATAELSGCLGAFGGAARLLNLHHTFACFAGGKLQDVFKQGKYTVKAKNRNHQQNKPQSCWLKSYKMGTLKGAGVGL